MAASVSICSVIQEWARRIPNGRAILGAGRPPLSYERLAEQVRNTVTTLNGAGIGRGDRVAIVLANGPDLAVCCYAIACGATSAPLNPAYTATECEAFFSRLAPRALVTDLGVESAAIQAAQSARLPVIRLVAEQEAGAFHLEMPKELLRFAHGGETGRPAQAGMAQSEDIALLLHTSGSTSQPKMVPLTHTNLCSSALSIGSALALTPQDCCLVIMPLFHINALVTCGLSTLAAGGSLACPGEFHAPSFLDWMEEFQPTWFSAVPAMQEAIVARVRHANHQPRNWRLRFVRSSASSLSPQLREQIETLLGVPVIDGYGLTEANCSAMNPLPPGIRKPGSVGRIVCGQVSIMGEEGVLLATGETGEIVLRGPHVMHAYDDDDPQANRAAFMGDWFRTGDQGRLDRDGYLFLTGRIKEMINRGGEKIGPGEVDQALLAHPAVAEAVAFAVPDPSLGQDVAAAVVLRAGSHVTAGELREFVSERLAEFKVPRRIVFLAELPKGPTGKVQRMRLADQLCLAAPASVEASVDAPAGWTEWLLTEFWEDVLQRRPIGRHDDFIALGGHSLLGASILARVESCFGKRLSLSSLLEAPTVARMAALLGENSKPAASRAVPIQRGSIGAIPIYVLHASPIFGPLIQSLPEAQPLLAVSYFDANSLAGDFTLADIARIQIGAIQEFQPQGPYILAGWCAEGILAYEMAQQLRAQGHEVPLLVLMDAFNPARTQQDIGWARWLRRFADRLSRERFYWQNQGGRGPERALGYVRARWRAWKERLDVSQRPKTPDAYWCLIRAIRGYTPSPYRGAVLHFRAQYRRKGGTGDPVEGWRRMVSDMEVCDVPGGHEEMFGEPNVHSMAQKLAARMAAVAEGESEHIKARGAALR
jgi:acyl-CoA synthetase (AMP-forming)/AMP-acid ligase II/thioesterase domain-containing protein